MSSASMMGIEQLLKEREREGFLKAMTFLISQNKIRENVHPHGWGMKAGKGAPNPLILARANLEAMYNTLLREDIAEYGYTRRGDGTIVPKKISELTAQIAIDLDRLNGLHEYFEDIIMNQPDLMAKVMQEKHARTVLTGSGVKFQDTMTGDTTGSDPPDAGDKPPK